MKILVSCFFVFLLVFTLVVCSSLIYTSISPKAYTSAARVRIDARVYKTTDLDLIKSETLMLGSDLILKRVIANLNLNVTWGKKYFDGKTLKSWESLEILKGRMNVHSLANTSLIEVRVFEDNPQDAALLANAIVSAYVDYAVTNSEEPKVQIVDTAKSSLIPVRPNKALNLTIGCLVGIVLGLFISGGIWVLLFMKNGRVSQISKESNNVAA